MAKVTIAVCLDDKLADRLKKVATKENSSVSRLVSIALEKYIKREERKQTNE